MKSQKLWHALLCSGFIVAFFFSPQKAFAARSVTISADKTVLNGYEDMTITASSMSGFTDGEIIYIKGAFYKDGSTNYFGYTQSNNTWIKNGDSSLNQRQVVIGNWDGKLIVKSDFDDSGYQGEGEYKLKVGFYYTTSGSNVSSVNWSANSLTIAINNLDPTPTPTPIPATNTSAPTATAKPMFTQKPIATKFPTITAAISSFSTESSESAILGGSDSAMPTLVKGMQDKKKSETNYVAIFLILGGVIILSGCGILLFYNYKKGKTIHETTDE